MRAGVVSGFGLLGLLLLSGLTFGLTAVEVPGRAKSASSPDDCQFRAGHIHAEKWSLDAQKDKEVVVVAFVGTECPLAKLYDPRLAQLAGELCRQERGFCRHRFQCAGLAGRIDRLRAHGTPRVSGAAGRQERGGPPVWRDAQSDGFRSRSGSGGPLSRPHRRSIRRRICGRKPNVRTSSWRSMTCWPVTTSRWPRRRSSVA